MIFISLNGLVFIFNVLFGCFLRNKMIDSQKSCLHCGKSASIVCSLFPKCHLQCIVGHVL